MRRILAALDRHWFAPASLRELALVRILAFGSQTLLFLAVPGGSLRPIEDQLAQGDMHLMPFEPVAVVKLLMLPLAAIGIPQPDRALLTIVFAVAVGAGLLATIGLWARVSMPLAALAHLFMVAHWYSYGDHHHAEAILLIALGVLALGPSAAAWSVDAWRRERRGAMPPRDARMLARWPLRLIQWILVLTYLSAAMEKLMHGGIQWFNGHTMMHHFLFRATRGENEIALWLATLPPWAHVAPSLFAWLVEALFALAILAPRTAWIFVGSGLAMHLGVYVVMDIAFFQTMLLYVVFLGSVRRYPPRPRAWLATRRFARRDRTVAREVAAAA